MKPSPSHFLAIKEVAALLKIDVKTVYKLAKQGEIPGHFKIGSIHFIDEEVFFAELKKRATQKPTKQIHQTRPDRHGLMN